MLPGFRFLFAAIVLSMSILVFALGAAALLRAAHEEFAANPTWRAAPEPVFAQNEATKAATLAMLRVEPQIAEPKPVVSATAFAPTEPAPSASPEAERAPTPTPESSPLADAARQDLKPDTRIASSADTPPAQPATPVEAASAQAAAEPAATRVAATADAAPATSETAAPAQAKTDTVAAVQPAPVPVPVAATPPQATESDQTAKKVANLGNTSANESEETKSADAKAEQRARLRAARAKARRRLAAERARLARQQAAAITPQFPLQQPATDPFGQQQQQPATTPRASRAARAQP